MKKKIIFLILIILVSLSLSACDSDNGDDYGEDGGKTFYFNLKNVSKEAWALHFDLAVHKAGIDYMDPSTQFLRGFLLQPGESSEGYYRESALKNDQSYKELSDNSFEIELVLIASKKKEEAYKDTYRGEYVQILPVTASYNKKPLIIEWNGSEFKLAK